LSASGFSGLQDGQDSSFVNVVLSLVFPVVKMNYELGINVVVIKENCTAYRFPPL
jgi:hypothetical protein